VKAITTTTYLKARSFPKAIGNTTPEELLNGRKFIMKYL
jgi:hypothetical protein